MGDITNGTDHVHTPDHTKDDVITFERYLAQLYARSEDDIKMTISSTLQSIFSFRTGSTTVLASLFYFAVFVSLYITQSGPQVPSVDRQLTLGLSVDQAFRDLHLVGFMCHAILNSSSIFAS